MIAKGDHEEKLSTFQVKNNLSQSRSIWKLTKKSLLASCAKNNTHLILNNDFMVSRSTIRNHSSLHFARCKYSIKQGQKR